MEVPPVPFFDHQQKSLEKLWLAWFLVIPVWIIGWILLEQLFFIEGPNRSNPYCFLMPLWTIFCFWKWHDIKGRVKVLDDQKLEWESWSRRREEHKARKKEKRRVEKLETARHEVIEQHLSSVKERADQLVPFAENIFPEARYFKYYGEITAWEEGKPTPSSKVAEFTFTTNIGVFSCEDILERSDESIDTEIVRFHQHGQTGSSSGSNSGSEPKPKHDKESRVCEEKWDILCSGKGNIRYEGKWMCYHCQREHEQHWVWDDS